MGEIKAMLGIIIGLLAISILVNGYALIWQPRVAIHCLNPNNASDWICE